MKAVWRQVVRGVASQRGGGLFADVLPLLYRALPLWRLGERMRGGACLALSADPLVLHVPDWVLDDVPGALLPLFRRYRHGPVYLFVELSWAHDDAWQLDRLARWKAQHGLRYPRHRMLFLANTEVEHRMMTARGLGSAWVSRNVFADPGTYRPLPGSEKRFDAVYDARVCPFKRHALAAGIERLALVAVRVEDHHDESYVRSVREALPQAHWFNDPLAPDYRSLDGAEINAAINQARVGLCLSAVEGAMLASIQYLLAGLPVVSTASRGGRDAFFDPDYVRIVADDPASVAAGVREMASCPVPAEEIRRRTLERIEPHKARLFELLDMICAAERRPAISRSRWASWASPQLTGMVAPAEIRKRIEEARRFRDDG